MVAKITNADGNVCVKHTTSRHLFREDGIDLMISILDPPLALGNFHIPTSLNLEILERIFECHCLSRDESRRILDWRLTCKAFNGIANRLIVSLKTIDFLNFPRASPAITHYARVKPDRRLILGRDRMGKLFAWGAPWELTNASEEGFEELAWRCINRESGSGLGARHWIYMVVDWLRSMIRIKECRT